MSITEEKAFAKLNISLDVTAKRPDGFHDMLMVMQSVSLHDTVTVELTGSGRCRASSEYHYIPSDERNLAVRAAMRFFAAAGLEGAGANISLRKRIPVGAGMAGGSSDAAAVLRALNRLCGTGFSADELEGLAADIGSDVAFCVSGGTALASGRGEKLTRLPSLPECTMVICKPGFSISTPELFKKLDSVKLRCHPDTAGIREALNRGSLDDVARRMYNVFESVPDRRMNTVAEIKSRMLDCKALGSVMTGTGSSVFGVFRSAADAEKACRELSKDHRFCCIAEPQKRIEV